MQFNTDKPIKNSSEDLLGRKSFSKTLAEAVDKYKENESLVIGLFGKWGVGKTSIINMILENLNDKIVVHFSPWNYSTHSDLINLFFLELKQSILDSGNVQDEKSLEKAFLKYKRAIKDVSKNPIVRGLLSALLQKLFGVHLEELWSPPSLEKTRDQLIKELKKTNCKIIVVIDDIDRLTNEQVRDIFQLVKQVANFPNVIYLLSMDREIVCRALHEVQKVDGHEYLDKIIQIPIEIPELRKNKLYEVLRQKLNLIRSSFAKEIGVDRLYYSKVFENCVMPYVTTLRDVNKIINTFVFRFGNFCEETCFEDMLALTVVEVLEPKLYRWIASNKENLCESFYLGIEAGYEGEDYYIEKYSEEFKELNVDPKKARKFLATIFPLFAQQVRIPSYGYSDSTGTRKFKRVANSEKFDLYFIFDFDDVKVPSATIDGFVFDFDEVDMTQKLIKINNDGSMYYFLEELKPIVNSIPENRLKVIAKVLLRFQGNYRERDEQWLIKIETEGKALDTSEAILKRINNEDERFEVIVDAVNNVKVKGLGKIGSLIKNIEFAHARLGRTKEKEENQIIGIARLLEIEKLFINRIQNIVKEGTFFEIADMRMICYLWKNFDENGFKDFLSKKLSDRIFKMKFLCAVIGELDLIVRRYDIKEFSDYLSEEDLYKNIKLLSKSELNQFNESEQLVLALYALNYERNGDYDTDVEEAKKLVTEWKEKD